MGQDPGAIDNTCDMGHMGDSAPAPEGVLEGISDYLQLRPPRLSADAALPAELLGPITMIWKRDQILRRLWARYS